MTALDAAEAAYGEYRASVTRGSLFTFGEPPPVWDQLGQADRETWKGIALAAIGAYKADRSAQVAEWEHVTSTAAGGPS